MKVMRILLILLCMVVVFLLIVYVDSLHDFAAIKPGMTRVEVEKLFRMDGGLQSPSHVRFGHPRSMHFWVDVGFSCRRDTEGRAIRSPDDRVTTVSLPHFGRPTSD